MKKPVSFLIAFAAIIISMSCKKSSTTKDSPTSGTSTVPDIYKKIYGATSITSDGTYIYIKSNGLPDHKSAYYSSNNSLYENYNGKAFGNNQFNKNPNTISSQNYTFKIPLNPTVASTHSATPLGAMGVALNGVPIFNQYAGP